MRIFALDACIRLCKNQEMIGKTVILFQGKVIQFQLLVMADNKKGLVDIIN